MACRWWLQLTGLVSCYTGVCASHGRRLLGFKIVSGPMTLGVLSGARDVCVRRKHVCACVCGCVLIYLICLSYECWKTDVYARLREAS